MANERHWCKKTKLEPPDRRLAQGKKAGIVLFETAKNQQFHEFRPAAAEDSRAYSPSKVIHKREGGALLAPSFLIVNNFGGGAKMCCKKPLILPDPWIGHAGTGRRIRRSNATTFTRRLSLRHPAPDRKGMLRTFRLPVPTGRDEPL